MKESALPVTTYSADTLRSKTKKAEVKDEKAPGPDDGRRDEGLLRYGIAVEERAAYGAAADRDSENEEQGRGGFARGGKGTRPGARTDRDHAGRVEVHGFAGGVRDRDDHPG